MHTYHTRTHTRPHTPPPTAYTHTHLRLLVHLVLQAQRGVACRTVQLRSQAARCGVQVHTPGVEGAARVVVAALGDFLEGGRGRGFRV